MGSFSPMHWMIVAAVILVLFGSGRVSGLMGDLAKGIKTFKQTMAEDSEESAIARLPHDQGLAGASSAVERKQTVA